MLGLVYTIKVFDVIMVVTGGGPANATPDAHHLVLPPVLPGLRVRAGRRGRQRADPGGDGVRADVPALGEGDPGGGGGMKTSSWPRTVFGVLIVAVLLFPLYWMVNASFQPSGALLQARTRTGSPPAAPWTATARRWPAQGPHLLSSVVVALGAVRRVAGDRRPGVVRAGAAEGPRRAGAGVRAADRADDPRHRDGQRALHRVQRPGADRQLPRAGARGLDRDHPVRGARAAGVHDVRCRGS